MSGKKRGRRSAWTRGAGIAAFAARIARSKALQSTAPLDQSDAQRLAIGARLALAAMTKGTAGDADLGALGAALNVGIVLSDAGMGAEHAQVFQRVADVIGAAQRRSAASGRSTILLRDSEADVIGDALDVYEAQLQVCTEGELTAAVAEMERRIAAGHVHDCRGEPAHA